MQIYFFNTGGFVCHKIVLAGYANHFSAWYDADGNLLDCETLNDRTGQARPVHQNSKARAMLQTIGQRCKR